MTGQNDNDIVDGGVGTNVLKGSAGDDTITSGGQDTADGGAGADSLTASAGGAVFDGGDGDDVLQGAGGADTLRGGAGNDQLLGEDGDDRLDGGTGDDSLDGGLGLNTVAGGDGNDVITLSGSAGEQADGGAGDDQLAAGDTGARMDGGPGRDTLTGGAGPDALSGGAGDDRLDGGDGADGLDGGDGADSLVGGLGPDVMAGGPGADRVSYADVSAGVTASLDDQANDGPAGEGDNVRFDIETLTGSPGDDRLSAGAGPATLQGAEGADTLIGGPAGDTVAGGANDDLLDGGGGPDTLIGEDGTDTVSYAARANGVRVALGAGTPVSGEPGEADLIDASVENAQTGSGPDTVSGAAGVPNVVNTGAGNDTLNFRDGDVFTDQLTCGVGLDNAQADDTDVQGPDCEKLMVAGKAVPLNVAYTGASVVRVGSEGVVSITISCGSTATTRCSGSVLLRDAAFKSIGKKTSFRVPAGQSKSVRVRILTERIRRLRRTAPKTRSITARIDATDLGGRTARVTRKLKIAYRKTR